MRERLAQYYRETHIFTARFQCYGKTDNGSNVACFDHIRICTQWVADHIWIHRSQHMKKLDLQTGDMVEFEARVGRYVHGTPRPHMKQVQYDYNLEKVSDLKVIRRHGENEHGKVE